MKKMILHIQKHRVLYALMILFVSIMVVHLVYNNGMYGDDATFYVFFPEKHANVFEFLKYRYNHWTSRLSVETVMFCFIQHKFAFAVLDSLVFVVLAYSLYLLFNKKSIIVSLIVLCMFPFYHYVSCGLYSASVNYTWPIAFLAYGFVYVNKILKNQNLNIIELILMYFCFVFVSFVEICTVLMFVYLLVAIIFNYIKNKKISITLIVAMLVAIIGIIVFLLSPGNVNRSVQELKYFPEYEEFNIVQKLTYGLVFVGNANSLYPTPINICLCVLLIYAAFTCKKDIFTKLCSLAPAVMFGLFYLIYNVVGLLNGNLNFEFLTYANKLKFDEALIYILCLHAVIVTAALFISIYRIFKGKQRIFLLISYILAVGLIGSFGLNGSISFFADYRPTIFSTLLFVLICLEIFFGIKELKDKNYNGDLILLQ